MRVRVPEYGAAAAAAASASAGLFLSRRGLSS